jgi:hypothetical protein
VTTVATEVPIVLCIDVEPDARLVDRANPVAWAGFERFMTKVPALREMVAAVTGRPPRFTWYLRMDDQVAETWGSHRWVADQYGEHLAALQDAGDELGLHIHTWRWVDSVGSWLAEREDAQWIARCTTAALDAFEASFGHPCRSHRGGDRYLDATMMAILRERGVTTELTVEPGAAPTGPLGRGELARGTTSDYRTAPFEPYHPHSAEHFLTLGGGEPLMMPMFSTRFGAGRALLWITIEPTSFAALLTSALETWTPAAMAFVVRTDLARLPEWDWFTTNLALVAEATSTMGGCFVTAAEAADLAVRAR